MLECRFKFDCHGLGDVVHFAHAVQLWKKRGYDVTVQVEENKIFVWQVAGVNIVQGGDLPNHGYGYPDGFDDLSLRRLRYQQSRIRDARQRDARFGDLKPAGVGRTLQRPIMRSTFRRRASS